MMSDIRPTWRQMLQQDLKKIKKIWLYIVRELMFDFEPFQFYFEEKSIIWIDDFQIVYNAVIKNY
jgi:hypothetical protein